jgi:hypothetical protein
MPNWRCSKCNSENHPDGNFCRSCGEPRPKPEPARIPDPVSELIGGGLRSQSQGIPDQFKSSLGSSFGKESRASASDFSSSLSKFSQMKIQAPNLDAIPTTTPTAGHVTTRNLELELALYPRINYVLAHCSLPTIFSLAIRNTAYQAAQDVMLKAWIATDYGEPWQTTIKFIPPQKTFVAKNIVIPLTKSRLQQVRESERANLRIDIFTEGTLQISETVPIEVIPYNEWFYHPSFAEIMACFVQPNSEAIEKIISMVRDRLAREFKDTSLDGYQSGDPRKVTQMLEALYLTLQKDLQLSYINPPPSFEKPEVTMDGSHTISQKVFFPEQIVKHRRGTCLDLALMGAACVERMGLHPLCFLIQGHAFFGAWTVEQRADMAAIKNHNAVRQLISAGAWLPLNSTTFALTPPKNFLECIEEGMYCLSDPSVFWCALDVAAARKAGFKPIPPIEIAPGTVMGPGLGGGY